MHHLLFDRLGPGERLHGPEEVESAIRAMADSINGDLARIAPHETVLVLCVLTGAVVFTGHLLPHLHFPLELDCLRVSRYGAETSGGELHWFARPQQSLRGRIVLLLDDILDEGHTLKAIQEYCAREGAARVLTAVLVRKQRIRPVEVPLDYLGLEVPDRFVFGYGMDAGGLGRNAPGIYALKESQ